MTAGSFDYAIRFAKEPIAPLTRSVPRLFRVLIEGLGFAPQVLIGLRSLRILSCR